MRYITITQSKRPSRPNVKRQRKAHYNVACELHGHLGTQTTVDYGWGRVQLHRDIDECFLPAYAILYDPTMKRYDIYLETGYIGHRSSLENSRILAEKTAV